MTAQAGFRIGVVGATGALGGEVLAVLSECALPVRGILPVATERSVGHSIEFAGETVAVETELSDLRALDLILLCAPPAVSLEFARAALRAEVACIDLSGALLDSGEVPLRVAGETTAAAPAPLVTAPGGAALAWALVLRPLARLAPLERVVGTVLESASVGGRGGIESLYQESLALFGQQDAPEPEVFGRPVAFDCLPASGELDATGRSEPERRLAAALGRLLDPEPRLAVAVVQVPAFAGQGSLLAVEAARPLDPKRAAEALERAPGVELWRGEPDGATTRAAAGRDAVLVARLRADPSVEHGLLLWLACDPLRLAAANAVALAVERLAPPARRAH